MVKMKNVCIAVPRPDGNANADAIGGFW